MFGKVEAYELVSEFVLNLRNKNSMSEIIHLQLGEQIYKVASISELIKGERNDFIKVLLNENSEIEQSGKIKVEFTIHPENIARKEIISEEVILSGFENKISKRGSNNINYMNLYPNFGFENFPGQILVVYQTSFNLGFSFPRKEEGFKDNLLKLEIKHDEPFWLGILFCKKKDQLDELLNGNNIDEYKIIQCQKGFVIIAVKRLIPYWEKLKVPKGSEIFAKTTWNEKFYLKTIY